MTELSKDIKFEYIFEPDSGEKTEFTILLDGSTLLHKHRAAEPLPHWTTLKFTQCESCPFDADKQIYCPIAAGLADLIHTFKDTLSHQEGLITVNTNERTIIKRTTMQEGISSLIGIFMVTSGCPIMEKLKPMVRYHLPFASIDETIYRVTSMYLLGQYFVKKHNKTADWDLKELIKAYKEITKLNQETSQRIRMASNQDASINALVILDVFAKMLPYSIEETLDKLEYLFDGYIK